MKAELKGLIFVDLEDPNALYSPKDIEDFGKVAQISVGPKDQEGSEIFEILICSPKWIDRNFREEGYMWGINTLILPEYNYKVVKDAVSRYIDSYEDKDWPSLIGKLRAIGRWEFENYQT